MSVALRILVLQLVCILVVSSKSTTVNLPEGYTRFPTVNAAYKVHTEERTFANANTTCFDEGGRLAYINTHEKLGFVRSITPEARDMWVGFWYNTEIHKFYTADTNLPFEWRNLPWETGQPSGFTGVYIRAWSRALAVAGNYGWDIVKSFVCEIRTATQ